MAARAAWSSAMWLQHVGGIDDLIGPFGAPLQAAQTMETPLREDPALARVDLQAVRFRPPLPEPLDG
jgi:hypothetical protein